MSEGVPLDTESQEWKEHKAHRTKLWHVMNEVAMVNRGDLPACNNKDCERAGVLLLDGIWWCSDCHRVNVVS